MNAFTESNATGRGRRELRKEETRARILEVARSHFERDGFEKTSVRAIASEAGVAAGTVLLHFVDKRDLLHAALFDDLAATIEQAIAARGRGRLETRLRALARPFFAYYAARPALSKTLLREALLAEPPWQERFTGQVGRVHAHIVGLVEEAKSRGEIASDVDAVLLGVSFFSFYYFALIGWVQGALPDPVPLFERLLSEHLRGLGEKTARRKVR